jgi:hypothetical protein
VDAAYSASRNEVDLLLRTMFTSWTHVDRGNKITAVGTDLAKAAPEWVPARPFAGERHV